MLFFKKENSLIILNSIKCPDNTILTSRFIHDYQTHIDTTTGESYFTDGGTAYLRRSINIIPYEDLTVYSDAPFEVLRTVIRWGTYGKSGREELRWVTLDCMSNEHIKNIILTQKQINKFFKKQLNKELKYRRKNKIVLEDL